MTSTDNTIRTRQNMEVLDVWKNLNSQVNAITKRQIAVFPDSVKPKTQRDLEVEVNVDKSIEGLNAILESRLAALEFVLKNDTQLKGAVVPVVARPIAPDEDDVKAEPAIPPFRAYAEENKEDRRQAEREMRQRDRLLAEREARRIAEAEARVRREAEQKSAQVSGEIQKSAKELPFTNAYQEVINTGSIVSTWNAIVRYYTKQGLSKTTQEMIKVKVQDLTPNLEAMIYGLGEAVDVLFTRKFDSALGMKILEIMRTLSIYRLVKQQVDTAGFELISVPLMDTSFKNLFAELSQERRELLAEISQRGTSGNRLAQRPIRIIPQFDTGNFQERLKALMSELGVRTLPQDLVASLKKMNKADFERYVDEAVRQTREVHRPPLDAQERRLAQRAQELNQQIIDLQSVIRVQIPMDIEDLEARADRLREPYEEAKYEAQMIEIPEGGIHPEPLNVDDFKDEDGVVDEDRWMVAVAQYQDEEEEADRQDRERDRAIAHNRDVEDSKLEDEAERQEMLRAVEQEIVEKGDLLRRLEVDLETAGDELDQIEATAEDRKSVWVDSVLDALREYREANIERLRQQRTRGKGKPKGADIDTRGLASLRYHYGAEDSESETESDSDEESDSESDEDVLDFDDRRNDMYYSRPRK